MYLLGIVQDSTLTGEPTKNYTVHLHSTAAGVSSVIIAAVCKPLLAAGNTCTHGSIWRHTHTVHCEVLSFYYDYFSWTDLVGWLRRK